METASLTLAYDHARAASVATQSSDTTIAINEHALAAGEFSKAASGTSSTEALRTLKLLEQHHQKLSELLRMPTTNSSEATPKEPEVQTIAEKAVSTSAAVAELRASKSDLGPRVASPIHNPPTLPHPRRLPPRDLSSSIASNLASARGIRANYIRQPLSPSVSTHQAPGSLEALPRRDGKRAAPSSVSQHAQPSWVPPVHSNVRKAEIAELKPVAATDTTAPNEEGFSRFYNTFENILSRLSAPLAFAGLPLVAEETPAVQAPKTSPPLKRSASRNSKEQTWSDEPDLTKYISRAALRASARDGQSANDSFYVVPTTGHTISYAHILSFDQREKRRLAASMHSENPELFGEGEEDDFVDARETPMPPTPQLSRGNSRKVHGNDLENRVEELDTENRSLKACIEKLTKRLHAFEMSAQQNSMALAESMRLMRDMSPGRVGSTPDDGLKRRLLELEDQIQRGGQVTERLSKENDKLKSVVQRYRERWEKLKEGAKMRREGSDVGTVKAAQSAGGPGAG